MSDGEALSLLGLQIVMILINQVLHVTTNHLVLGTAVCGQMQKSLDKTADCYQTDHALLD